MYFVNHSLERHPIPRFVVHHVAYFWLSLYPGPLCVSSSDTEKRKSGPVMGKGMVVTWCVDTLSKATQNTGIISQELQVTARTVRVKSRSADCSRMKSADTKLKPSLYLSVS